MARMSKGMSTVAADRQNKTGEETQLSKDTLSITDNRSGKSYEIDVQEGAIRAMDLRQIKTSNEDFGLLTYDPGFVNTASCRSRVTFIDGDQGILLYRGYPIQQLAEKSTFMETAYLLLHGDLPSEEEFRSFRHEIIQHTLLHENIKKFMDGFHHDAHPMGMLCSAVDRKSVV